MDSKTDEESPILRYMMAYIESLEQGFQALLGESIYTSVAEKNDPKIEEAAKFNTNKAYIIQIPFSGTISGDYFLCLDFKAWANKIASSLGLGEDEEIAKSAAKEFLNTVVGDAIQPLSKDFPGLTYQAPRIIVGSVDYPAVKTLKSRINNQDCGEIEIMLSLDLMHQEIGTRLDDEIQRVIEEQERSRRAEQTIQSILDNINLGIFKIDLEAVILPGSSAVLADLFFRSIDEMIDRKLVDCFPEEISLLIGSSFTQWMEDLKSWEPRSKEWEQVFSECPLKEVEFVRAGSQYNYEFKFHHAQDQLGDGLLVVVEEVTQRRILEQKLISETETKAMLESRLKMANEIQQALLPSNENIPGLDIAASYHPAEEVGGDWYGYYHDNESDTVDIYMGDVTGHGVGAALLTALSCGAVYSIERLMDHLNLSYHGADRISTIAQLLDIVIGQIGDGNKVMSMVFLSLDLKTGSLSYLNAGHLPSFVIRSDTHAVDVMLAPGSLLGSTAETTFGKKELNLRSGDLVVVFTDGLIENQGPTGKVMKLKQLKKLLADQNSPSFTIDSIINCAKQIWQDRPGVDDVAVLAFRWNGADGFTKSLPSKPFLRKG